MNIDCIVREPVPEPVCKTKTKIVYYVSSKENIKFVESCRQVLFGDIMLIPQDDDDKVCVYIPFYSCKLQKCAKAYHFWGTGTGSDEKYVSGQYNVSGFDEIDDCPMHDWSWLELEQASWFPKWLESTGKESWRELPWCLGIALAWLDEAPSSADFLQIILP